MLLFQTTGPVKGSPPEKKEDTARTFVPGIPAEEKKDSAKTSFRLDSVPVKTAPAPPPQKRPVKAKKKSSKKSRPQSAYELGLQVIDPAKREGARKSYEQAMAVLRTNIQNGEKRMNELKKAYPQLNDACNKAVSDAYIEEGFKYVISGFENHSTSQRPGQPEYNRGQDMVERAEAAFRKAAGYYGSNKENIAARLKKLIQEDNDSWAPLIARGMQGTETRTYPKRVQGLVDRLAEFK